MTSHNFTMRKNQIKTGDILDHLKNTIPSDAFCMLVTFTLNVFFVTIKYTFSYFLASLVSRVGVFSFARYDPVFYDEKRGKDYKQILLWRSIRVVVHEIGHMFGMKHCIYFNCLMRGSMHLAVRIPKFFLLFQKLDFQVE
jgi:archaemetzincin